MQSPTNHEVAAYIPFFISIYQFRPMHAFTLEAPFSKLHISAETVEKVQMANSDNFCTVKNQQLTGHRKPKNAEI
jgi:hypothetical protein